MNRWTICLLSVCIAALLAACQPKAQKLLPITGAQEAALIAPAALARDHVLQYLVSSSRLVTLPPSTDWQLMEGEGPQREYEFRNGDWLMLVRMADSRYAHQEVILINQVAQASWSGYITPDGRVVDTAYGR